MEEKKGLLVNIGGVGGEFLVRFSVRMVLYAGIISGVMKTLLRVMERVQCIIIIVGFW